MATLSRELRKGLERVVLKARAEAEAGARKALEQLAVANREPWPTMTREQQALRRRLRARGRQLGDRLEDGRQQGVEHLVSECAYEQWHRMLFARYLAESELLLEPESGASVSVDECKELARARRVDWISLASTFAQAMLPQIFRAGEAALEIALPAEHRAPLEQLLMSLPPEVFLSDDSLGWVYQYWQSEQKERVNKAGTRIGADELPAVTQLFTEDYMVEFLLHNTLGAWWAGRQCPTGIQADTEEEARAAVALPQAQWRRLRLVRGDDGNWLPAAGTFVRWPTQARQLRLLDPCMGSGHFLVFALPLLAAMRRVEEGVSWSAACVSVLRDNLYGLEVDARCTQIAAFNLALTVWRTAGWQPLPRLNVACSGLAPNATSEDWMKLAVGNEEAEHGMRLLYELFSQAPVLGSLIDPRRLGGDLLVAEFAELEPLLSSALKAEQTELPMQELAATAQGVAKAAEILASRFTLVVTNVPYLGRSKQVDTLKKHCDAFYADAKWDLATAFVERCQSMAQDRGTVAVVTPQQWCFGDKYKSFRKHQIRRTTWHLLARLGTNAFEAISGEVVNVVLVIESVTPAQEQTTVSALDLSALGSPAEKADRVGASAVSVFNQLGQLRNPDCRITLADPSEKKTLGTFAKSTEGLSAGDGERFIQRFWENEADGSQWRFLQSAPEAGGMYCGLSDIVLWDDGTGEMARSAAARVRGHSAWGKPGIVVAKMNTIRAAVYLGELFAKNCAVLSLSSANDRAAVLEFVSSQEFAEGIERLDANLNTATSVFEKVPCDITYWRQLAAEKYPNGLPAPCSTDPTQGLFIGHPKQSDHPLQVAVARLLGYRWPRQTGYEFVDCSSLGNDGLESLADDDGIVCVSSIKGEEPAAERLRRLLSAAFGSEWSASRLEDLLGRARYAGKTLEDWLRNGFFEQHCELFRHRPFIWQVWDGRQDGFSALLNYQRLTRATLEKLTYAYVGDWIRRQESAVGAGEPGSDARLVAAKQLQRELKAILDGQPPYDIFVRWKPLESQAIGWEPDLNDGVRINIRPFLSAVDVGKKGAGILRGKPNVAWGKDRGKEPYRSKDDFPWFWGWDGRTRDFAGGAEFDGNRWNDLHYSREFKVTARRSKGLA